jgi:heat shock protein HslJ
VIRLAGITAAVAITACTSVNSAGLAGSEWRVTAINGQATPAPPASYRMRFEARSLGGQFGCNHFGGDYRVSGDVLTTGAMMMTEMACSEPANSFEGWGMAILQQPARLTWRDPAMLTLSNAAGSIELQRR